MRISIVPAQITTVEDKIAGNISVQQAILLGVPLLMGFVVILIFPPSGQFVAYKVVITSVLFIICAALAIRIKEKIIADWIKLLAIYCARPQYYLYDKNSTYLRKSEEPTSNMKMANEADPLPVKKITIPKHNIPTKEFTRLEQFANDARAGMKFEVGKRGKLNVRITEVK